MFGNGTWCSGRVSGVQKRIPGVQESYLVLRKGIWCSGRVPGVQ